MRYPVVPLRLVGFIFASSAVLAHPDHSATQAQIIEIVPATESSPGASVVSFTIADGKRVVVANGLPDHKTGRFPNRDNPNAITAQNYRYSMSLNPKPAVKPTPLIRQPFGIALNGVLFDPGTAETWQNDRASGWHYEAKGGGFSLGLDANNAHVQPNGAYHYHGMPNALLQSLSGGKPKMVQVGWAADGFPIYAKWGYEQVKDTKSPIEVIKSSYRLKAGSRPGTNGQPGGKSDGVFVEDYEYVAGSGDLDECGGRFGITPEFPNGTYHYILTEDFPFIPRLFRGTPDASFKKRGQGPGAGPNSGPDRRPPPM
jgi:hypothetical protein